MPAVYFISSYPTHAHVIIVKYTFIVGPEHPNPGVPYWCLFCTAYLPDSQEGRELCKLLRKAFDDRLLFTIGVENTIVSNGIELKTNSSAGPTKYVLRVFNLTVRYYAFSTTREICHRSVLIMTTSNEH